MNETFIVVIIIAVITVAFACGFICGQISGCERGGCWAHGKNYKVKP